MASSTIRSHVKRAKAFFNIPSIYVGIGRTTAWPDDTNPPVVDTLATDIEEIVGFRKADNVFMVVRDDTNGTIEYQDSKWRIVPPDQAYTEGARWVFITATIRYNELPLGWYRQVGIYSDLIPNSGVTKFNLLPSEVQSHGDIEVIDNRQPSNRQQNQKETISIVIEF